MNKLMLTMLALALVFGMTLTACDGGGDDGTAPVITTASLPDGAVGTAYSQTLAATGDTPITWSIDTGALPDGLSLSGNTIAGTPAEAGTSNFTVKAANDAGSGTKALSIVIAPDEVVTGVINDFAFEDNGSGITITGYTGNGGAVAIPPTINGKPVVAIKDGDPEGGEGIFSGKGLTSVAIPNSVTTIGDFAFSYNQLTSVTIPDSVTTIGNDAFYYNQLTSVTIGEYVTIGNYALPEGFISVYNNGNKAAGTYTRGSNGWYIGDEDTTDFSYSYTDTTVTITGYTGSGGAVEIPPTINGKPVVSIESYAFSYNQLTSVTIPNSVTAIGDFAFAINQLTSVTIPDSVTYLSGFNGNQLTSVTIPNSVTTIGESAFANNQLTSVTIPNSVTAIGEHAFGWNQQLTSVTIGANVTIANDGLPAGFISVYDNGNKAAGTYTLSNNTWTKN